MATKSIQFRKTDNITLAMNLRTKYGVDEGDIYTLIDMGDGSFALTPHISPVNRLGDRVAEMIGEASRIAPAQVNFQSTSNLAQNQGDPVSFLMIERRNHLLPGGHEFWRFSPLKGFQ